MSDQLPKGFWTPAEHAAAMNARADDNRVAELEEELTQEQAKVKSLLDAQITAEELLDHLGDAECACDLSVGVVCEPCLAKNAWAALKRAREAAAPQRDETPAQAEGEKR